MKWKFDGRTYDPEHDFARLKGQLAKVLGILLDGKHHTTDELRARCGSAGDSRVRDLRKRAFGGFDIDTSRISEGSPHHHHILDLDSADPAFVAEILEGKLKLPPKPKIELPDDLRGALANLVEQLPEGKPLAKAYTAVKRLLVKAEEPEPEPEPDDSDPYSLWT